MAEVINGTHSHNRNSHVFNMSANIVSNKFI